MEKTPILDYNPRIALKRKRCYFASRIKNKIE